MIIGPFWCEQSDSWLRIVMEDDGTVFAEMAKRDKAKTNLTTGWKKEETQDFWVIKDAYNDNNEGLRLLNGKLYQTDFSKSSLTQNLNVRVYDKTGATFFYNINKEKNHPFEGRSNAPRKDFIPQQPLTPEAQFELEKTQQEEQKQAQELKLKMWQEWQKKNVHAQLNFEQFSTFCDYENNVLYEDLTSALTDFSTQDYTTVEDYQLALEQAIQMSLELNAIDNAVTAAVNKYKRWYNGEQTHRGENGFFSWFRHGRDGQQRAQQLKTDVENAGTDEDKIQLINPLLTYTATRYHRHSLSSFLLDELKDLKDLPWEGLKPDDESNRYDQKTVSDHLDKDHFEYNALN